MIKIVEIIQSAEPVAVNEKAQASIPFTVKNIKAIPVRVGAKIITEGSTQQSWFKLDKSEKQLGINATDQFTVLVEAKGAPQGKHAFSLLVYNVENSDEEYTQSGQVTLTIPEPEPIIKQKSNMWIVWLLVGLLVTALIGGGAYYFIKNQKEDKPSGPVQTPPPPPPTVEIKTQAIMPNVTGKLVDDAKAELEKLAFKDIKTDTKFDATAAKNTVLLQTPKVGEKSDPENTQVVLTLADSVTTMPDVKFLTLEAANSRLKERGFSQVTTVNKFVDQADLAKTPPGTILEQTPVPDTKVSSNETPVTLTIAFAGTKVPRLIDSTLTNALNAMKAANLVLSGVTEQDDASKAEQTVIGQTPQENTFIDEKVTQITLVVSRKPSAVPPVYTLHPSIWKQIQFSKVYVGKGLEPQINPTKDLAKQPK